MFELRTVGQIIISYRAAVVFEDFCAQHAAPPAPAVVRRGPGPLREQQQSRVEVTS